MSQTYHIYTLYYKSPSYRTRLNQLIKKFVFGINKKKISNLYNLIKKHRPDNEISSYIISLKKQYNKTQNKMNSKKRASKFATEWFKVLNKSIEIINDQFNYLDVGCNNGEITVKLGQLLNLKENQIHGIDVAQFTYQKIVPIKGFIYKEYDGYNIPYNNESFNMITCSMVLHHVEFQYILINEIVRILKPNGILMIKESDIYEVELEWLLFFEHLFYDMYDYNITYEHFKKNYYQNPLSKKKLADILSNYGLKKIKIRDKKNILARLDVYNPTKHYYALYQKIE